jgi:hypothetical protein
VYDAAFLSHLADEVRTRFGKEHPSPSSILLNPPLQHLIQPPQPATPSRPSPCRPLQAPHLVSLELCGVLDLSQPWAALGRLTHLAELRLYHGNMLGQQAPPGVGHEHGGMQPGRKKHEGTPARSGEQGGVFDLAWLPPSLRSLSAWLPAGSSVQLAGCPLPAHGAGLMPQGGPLAGLHSVAVCEAKGLVMVEASVRGDRARAHLVAAAVRAAKGTAAVGVAPSSDGWPRSGSGEEVGPEEEGREEEQGPAKEGVQEVGGNSASSGARQPGFGAPRWGREHGCGEPSREEGALP